MDGAGLVLLTYKKKENDFEFKIISSFRDFESFLLRRITRLWILLGVEMIRACFT